MKSRSMILFAGLLAVALAGCGKENTTPPATSTTTTTTATTTTETTTTAAAAPAEAAAPAAAAPMMNKAGKQVTIAVVPKSTGGEFWNTVRRGCDKAAAQYGVSVDWQGTTVETETAEQIKIIEGMVTKGVDGIVISPIDHQAIVKPIEAAVAAGIPAVGFDAELDTDKEVSFVATDNKKGGTLAGEAMVKLLGGADAKGKKVMVQRFLQGSANCELRAEGFIEVAKAAGIEIVADPHPEDGTVAGAKKTASNTYEGFVKDNDLQLDGIFACNLYTCIGAADALDDLRKQGVKVHAKYIGFDTSEPLLKALHAGTIDALVSQKPEKMGFLAVETMVKHLKGEAVEKRVDTGVELITVEALKNSAELRELAGEKE